MKKTIVLTAVITFLATTLLWFAVLLLAGGREELSLEATQGGATNAYSEMEASSNATLYDKEGNWLGTGMLVETTNKAYLQMGRDRYELDHSDVDGFRYLVPEENIYVK
ncbi:MAG: hypothetical protein J6I49_05815 [Bacteroidales bacterium]|nr:hypothetical protein [Bacteroidales bacterium]